MNTSLQFIGRGLAPVGYWVKSFRTLGRAGVLMCVAFLLLAGQAQAAFHLWNIREIYTDSSGTLQFIELFDSSGGQGAVGGEEISVSNVGATQTHTFELPAGSLAGNTFNHALLFGTAGVQAAGGPAPNYIIPDNFLFSAGGSISFFGANSGGYSALPTDGVLSRTWGDGDAINSPQNYAGQFGTVIVPEPSLVALFGLGGLILLWFSRGMIVSKRPSKVNTGS